MKASRIITCWDYHHGQSTRILVSGIPPLPGATMQEKQHHFQKNLDGVRAALLREPRGHRNMLGAIITDPVSPGSLLGALFTSPHGYFDMCGDSAFSLGAYLFDSGIVDFATDDTSRPVFVDTVAGPIELEISGRDGQLDSVTIGNVPSQFLGEVEISVPGHGTVRADLAYGGLVYAIASAADLGLASLDFTQLTPEDQRKVVDRGSALLQAARLTKTVRPVELVTLKQSTDDVNVSRVANFYAPGTMGRTPSGTGLSARLAVEHAKGDLKPHMPFSHQSAIGQLFHGKIVATRHLPDSSVEIVPKISAVSHLMGISQLVLKPDDPFCQGFWIEG